jgi:putative Holliday junction resolvase
VTRAAQKPPGGVLAIDHGTKRTGFAVSDPLRLITQPIDPWHGDGNSAALVDHVAHLLDERTIATFLVGFPFNMDRSEGPRAAEVKAFADRLAQRFPDVEIVLYDERLTTKAAEDLLREAGYHGLERKVRLDSWSALVLLRDWIESGEPGSRR